MTDWIDKENCNCTDHNCTNSATKDRYTDLEGLSICGHCYYGYCEDKKITEEISNELIAFPRKEAMV